MYVCHLCVRARLRVFFRNLTESAVVWFWTAGLRHCHSHVLGRHHMDIPGVYLFATPSVFADVSALMQWIFALLAIPIPLFSIVAALRMKIGPAVAVSFVKQKRRLGLLPDVRFVFQFCRRLFSWLLNLYGLPSLLCSSGQSARIMWVDPSPTLCGLLEDWCFRYVEQHPTCFLLRVVNLSCR